jgi:hypothetical protein
MTRPLHLAGLLAALALLASAAPAEAQHAAKGKDRQETDAPVAGQVAAVDAQGKLRAPTREEVKALLDSVDRSLLQSADGLREVQLPNGAVVVDLDGRFESVSVAKVEGGKVSTRCVETTDQARKFLEPGSPAPAPRAPAHEEK